MRISDWSSDVCSSDLLPDGPSISTARPPIATQEAWSVSDDMVVISNPSSCRCSSLVGERKPHDEAGAAQPVVSRFDRDPALLPLDDRACNGEAEIGRASCRERVGQYV